MRYIYIHEDGRIVKSDDLTEAGKFADGYGLTVIDAKTMTERCGKHWDPIPTIKGCAEEEERRSKRCWEEIDRLTGRKS